MNCQTFSDSYSRSLRSMHTSYPGWGCGRAEYYAPLVKALSPKSMIDYGCGKGGLVMAMRSTGIEVAGFDPGVAEWSTMPTGEYDLLTCLDVLEHIEPDFLEATLDKIREIGRAHV